MTPEHALQNDIRAALAGLCMLFRANVMKGQRADGRWFDSGLPPGFSDLFGMCVDGRFLAIEVKTKTGRVTKQQQAFIDAIRARGGRAGVARSVEDALAILGQP